jgi:hypothetical protein
MADEVFYSEGKLLSGRGQGIPASALSSGDELFYAEIIANFLTASTTLVDITGLTSGPVVTPEGPFCVEVVAPIIMEEISTTGTLTLLGGSTVLGSDDVRAPAATTGDNLRVIHRIPDSMFSPAPGSLVTYKAQLKTSVATSDASVFVDFAGRINPCFIRGWRV